MSDEDLAAKGLIPARAGKTARPLEEDPHAAAHPRAGGENSSDAMERVNRTGSSPRGRGKHGLVFRVG